MKAIGIFTPSRFMKILLILVLILITQFSYGQQFNDKSPNIHQAIAAGDLNKVRTLLEDDPPLLELKDNEGNTPLHLACGAFQVAIANFLIDKGAAANTRNNYGLTPLHRAIGGRGQDVDLIRKLIAKGADVHAKLDRGLNTLHFAAMINNLNIVKLLIDHGADLNAYDNICYGTVLQTAINMNPNEEVAKFLVEHGAKINQKFSFGNTELHLAAMKGYADLASLLVKHGADVNGVNDYNHTALYYAAKHGHRKTADALISAGANENSIVEINYGKASQLTAKLNKDEAYLWYLGGLYGGGYAIKTSEHLIIIDKTEINASTEACLANGNLNQKELADQNITILITKAAGLNNKR
jgi:ankyrin repeat protein